MNCGTRRHPILALSALAAALIASPAHAGNAVAYVNINAPAGGDGLSWATAFRDLEPARMLVNSNPTFGQIWVAQGTYKPTVMYEGSPREFSWFAPSNCQTLGGFVGNETNASQRDPVNNVTTISGDTGTAGVTTDNTRRIIRLASENTAANTVIDGFTITLGRADGNMQRGAAIFGDSGGATLRNCKFIDNRADLEGSAIYMTGTGVLENCTFLNNAVTLGGGFGCAASMSGGGSATGCTFTNNERGGLRGTTVLRDSTFENCGGNSFGAAQVSGEVRNCTFVNNASLFSTGGLVANGASLLISNCDFIHNTGGLYGGLNLTTTLTAVVINCMFRGNSGGQEGGAMRIGGTVSAQVRILNCDFSGNSAVAGGAIWQQNDTAVVIANSTFSQNSATGLAGGVRTVGAVTLVNSILWGNSVNGNTSEASQILKDAGTLSVNRTCIQGWTGSLGGIGNTGANPVFINALGPDSTVGTADDDLRLMPTSPCIDAGANASAPNDYGDYDNDGNIVEFVPIDVLGHARFFDAPGTPDTGTGTPPIIDMGACEFDGSGVPQPPGTYVGPPGGSWFIPANWAGNAVPDATTDVFIATSVVINQSGALAHALTIQNGGNLLLDGGGLTVAATTIVQSGGMLGLDGLNSIATMNGLTVEGGGSLLLDDATALLTASAITMQSGTNLTWNSGAIAINVGMWSSAATLNVGCTGNAEMRLLGGTVVAPQVSLCAQGRLTGNGTVNGNVTNSGQVAPGASPGVITINGSYMQSAAGVLNVEVQNYTPSGYDRLIVNGGATMGGTLTVTTLAGFAPTLAGDQRFVVASSQSGTFATLNLPSLPPAFAFSVQYQILMPDGDHQAVRLLTSLQTSGARLYVKASAAGGGDGQAWASASNDLRGALEQAALLSNIHEVWVTAGTYLPDAGSGERTATFRVGPGVALYGGFDGTETELEQRDFVGNVTTLSGDLLGNDGTVGTFANNGENVYHVVTTVCNLCPNPPRVDGFTITGGNSNQQNSGTNEVGGGIRGDADGQVIANCRVVHNYATQRGGGASVDLNSLVENCAFVSNKSLVESSALHVGGGSPQVVGCTFDGTTAVPLTAASAVTVPATANAAFVDCTFTNNSGINASVLKVLGNTFFSTTLDNCVFASNTAWNPLDAQPGATVTLTDCTFNLNVGRAIRSSGAKMLTMTGCTMSNNAGGGVVSSGSSGVVNFTADDCDFTGNTGGLFPHQGAALLLSSGAAVLTDCSFSNNTASDAGGAIYNGGTLTLDDCTFSGNTAPLGSGIYNWIAGTLYGQAALLGSDGLYNAGGLWPGPLNQHGQFTIEGTFHHANIIPFTSFTGLFPGTLHMSLGGVTPVTEHDVIDVAGGNVVLEGGALQVDLTGGFTPLIGQQFHIIKSQATTGHFDVATMPLLDGGLFLDLEYASDGVRVSVVQLVNLLTLDDGGTSTLTGSPVGGRLADLDNDGDLDVALIAPGSPISAPGQLAVIRNLGVDALGNWLGFDSTPLLATIGVDPRSIDVGYLNGDAFLDAVVTNYGSDTATVLFNAADGSGALNVATSLSVAQQPLSVAIVDAPGDQSCDIVVASAIGSVVRHYTNNGSGTFSAGSSFTHPRTPQFVVVADLDNDTYGDLVTVRRAAGDITTPALIEVRPFDSRNGMFGQSLEYQAGMGTTMCEAVSVTGDGLPDIVALDTAGGGMSILLNGANRSVSFTPPVRLPIGVQPRSLIAKDLDGDGDTDVAFLTTDPGTGQSRLQALRNDDNDVQMLFATAVNASMGGTTAFILAGDIDQSGGDDVLAINLGLPGNPAFMRVLHGAPAPACPGDTNHDHAVNVNDLLAVITAWGSCPAPCPADISPPGGDGVVNVNDLLFVIVGWGACP